MQGGRACKQSGKGRTDRYSGISGGDGIGQRNGIFNKIDEAMNSSPSRRSSITGNQTATAVFMVQGKQRGEAIFQRKSGRMGGEVQGMDSSDRQESHRTNTRAEREARRRPGRGRRGGKERRAEIREAHHQGQRAAKGLHEEIRGLARQMGETRDHPFPRGLLISTKYPTGPWTGDDMRESPPQSTHSGGSPQCARTVMLTEIESPGKPVGWTGS